MIPTTSAASTPSRRVTTRASNMGDSLTGRHLEPRLRPARRRALVAEAADLQGVVRREKTVRAADFGLQRGNPRAHELHHPAAAGADQMVVILAAVNEIGRASCRERV